MGYFFMFLWLLFGLVFSIGLVYWLVKKRHGKFVLYSLGLSVACLIIGMMLNAKEPSPVANDTIIDANQFSRITPEELVTIMGEPESKEEWTYKLSETRQYPTTTFYYENGKYEFMIIDNAVVRFTYNGEGLSKRNEKELFRMFNIDRGPNIKKTSDTPVAKRFSMVNNKIADYWITFSVDSTIFKITYNVNYF